MSEDQQAQGQPQEGAEGQAQEATEGQHSEATQDEAVERQNEDAAQAAEAKATSVEDLPEWAQKEIKALRRENQKTRQKRQEAEDAQKTEQERLSEEVAGLIDTNLGLTRQVRRSNFIEQIGLPNADAAWGYVLDGVAEVEWDEKNGVGNRDDVAKALKNHRPALFGNGSADGGRRGGNTGAPQNIHGSDLIRHAYEQASN